MYITRVLEQTLAHVDHSGFRPGSLYTAPEKRASSAIVPHILSFQLLCQSHILIYPSAYVPGIFLFSGKAISASVSVLLSLSNNRISGLLARIC